MKTKRQDTYQRRKNKRYRSILLALLSIPIIQIFMIFINDLPIPLINLTLDNQITLILIIVLGTGISYLVTVLYLIFPTSKEIRK